MEGNKPRASTMPTDALGIDWLEDDEFIARMEKAIMEGDVAEILKLTGAEEIFEEAKRQVCSLPLLKTFICTRGQLQMLHTEMPDIVSKSLQ